MILPIIRTLICVAAAHILVGTTAWAELRVGVILPLSGPLAEYGEAVRNSLELALDDENARSHPLKLVYEDVGADPKRAVSAFQKLATIDHVDMVYVWGVAFCKTVAPLAEMRGVLMVAQCVDRKSSTDRRYVVRFMNPAEEYIRELGRELHRRGIKRVGFVVGENPYLEEMVTAFGTIVEGIETVSIDRAPSDQMDFRTTLLQLREKKVDAIGVFLQGGQTAELYRQAREIQFKPATFGTNFFENLSEIQRSNGAMDGAFFINNRVDEAFIERYRKRFGNVSQLGFGALAYEFGRLLSKVSKAGDAKSDSVLRAIQSTSERGIAAGPYQYANESGDRFVHFPLVVKEIRDGGIVQTDH